MRRRSPLCHPLLLLFSSLPFSLAVGNIDCSHVRIDGQSFDLSPLAGPHAVSHISDKSDTSYTNTTFDIDLCAPLKKPKSIASKKDYCPNLTRVCGVSRVVSPGEGTSTIQHVIPVAGDYTHDARPLDAKWTRLKTSASHSDAKKEGLRLEMHGGKYPWTGKGGVSQMAVIELLCDADRTGNEGDVDGEERGGDERRRRRAEDDDEGDDGEDKDEDGNGDGDGDDESATGASLKFVSFDTVEDRKERILRLEWRTKYACEGRKGGDDSDDSRPGSGHWGFFTWFIIIAFLLTASYLIFGSWLNYNRYGARGWDLLPHGDTLRDLPYLLKDWTRRVVSTVQGGGGRGGYSAV